MYVRFGVKMMLSFGTKSAKGYYISSSFFVVGMPLFCQFSVVTVAMHVLVSWVFSCVLKHERIISVCVLVCAVYVYIPEDGPIRPKHVVGKNMWYNCAINELCRRKA
jgi:hypothetical protein